MRIVFVIKIVEITSVIYGKIIFSYKVSHTFPSTFQKTINRTLAL